MVFAFENAIPLPLGWVSRAFLRSTAYPTAPTVAGLRFHGTAIKLPFLHLSTGDWVKDPCLSLCSPSTRGVWIDLLCAIHEFDHAGLITGTASQLSRLCRCSPVEFVDATVELSHTRTADITERDGIYSVVSRRIKRDAQLRNIRSEAGIKGNVSRWGRKVIANPIAKASQSPESDIESEVEDRGLGKESEKTQGGYHAQTRTALHLLNEASGRHYRETASNLGVISARLEEPEVTIDGVREMIHRQGKKWKGTNMADYMRPETLFGKTKFDGYYAARKEPVIAEVDGRSGQRGFDRNKGTFNEGQAHLYVVPKANASPGV